MGAARWAVFGVLKGQRWQSEQHQDLQIRAALRPMHFGILAISSGCTYPMDEDHGLNVVN